MAVTDVWSNDRIVLIWKGFEYGPQVQDAIWLKSLWYITNDNRVRIKLQGHLSLALDFFQKFKDGDTILLAYWEIGTRDEANNIICRLENSKIIRKWIKDFVIIGPPADIIQFYMTIEATILW